MNGPRLAAAILALAGALSGCRGRAPAFLARPSPAFAPPAGKRAVSLSIDKSQARFLSPGDAVEVAVLLETPRPDGSDGARSEVLAPRAEVLRAAPDWGDETSLVQLALTPEEAQRAALAVDREDRVFLSRLPDPRPLARAVAPRAPTLEPGRRGVAVLVYPDQQEFLRPGDRVDVLAADRGERAQGRSRPSVVTLFQDVLILGARAAQDDEEWAAVQLMLTPEQAARMMRAVAEESDVSLAVRAPGDRATRPVEPAGTPTRGRGDIVQ